MSENDRTIHAGSESIDGDMLRADIVCACHKPDVGCAGALALHLPVSMFRAENEKVYQACRQSAVTDFLSIFDQFYEHARQMLETRSLVSFPKRTGRQLAVIDPTNLPKADHPLKAQDAEAETQLHEREDFPVAGC